MDERLYKNFKKVLKALHSQDILFCNATEAQVARALETARKTKKPKKR